MEHLTTKEQQALKRALKKSVRLVPKKKQNPKCGSASNAGLEPVAWRRTDVDRTLVTENGDIAYGWELDGLPHEALFTQEQIEIAVKAEREACAKIAETAAKMMGDLGRQHELDGNSENMDRCYARSLQCTQVAADIRTRSNVKVRGGATDEQGAKQ